MNQTPDLAMNPVLHIQETPILPVPDGSLSFSEEELSLIHPDSFLGWDPMGRKKSAISLIPKDEWNEIRDETTILRGVEYELVGFDTVYQMIYHREDLLYLNYAPNQIVEAWVHVGGTYEDSGELVPDFIVPHLLKVVYHKQEFVKEKEIWHGELAQRNVLSHLPFEVRDRIYAFCYPDYNSGPLKRVNKVKKVPRPAEKPWSMLSNLQQTCNFLYAEVSYFAYRNHWFYFCHSQNLFHFVRTTLHSPLPDRSRKLGTVTLDIRKFWPRLISTVEMKKVKRFYGQRVQSRDPLPNKPNIQYDEYLPINVPRNSKIGPIMDNDLIGWAKAVQTLLETHTIHTLILKVDNYSKAAFFFNSPFIKVLLNFHGKARVANLEFEGQLPTRSPSLQKELRDALVGVEERKEVIENEGLGEKVWVGGPEKMTRKRKRLEFHGDIGVES